jgi:anthranilate synthase component 1
VPPPLVTVDAPLDYDVCEASFTKERFFAAAEACLEEIRAGEIFQIQIGNRLTLRTKARPFDVFRHLRILNPSPYMFFYKFGEHHVLGASPEMMVGVQGGRVTHRPIAGTRRRTWDPAKDRAMREELTSSEKERAEHVMLVDLGRNDVGRVARPGSVKVEELMMVEEYSHVFHMVSQVTGELAAGVDAFEALAVAFPNGTVSGAPKIRAQQLINQHEQISREFYAGSLGLFDFFGNLRSTILIRSIHMAGGRASTQASAGIVYDSTPAEEWLETRNKMAACLTAMQNTR